MTWLAWRQFRLQAAVGFGALLAVAVLILVTGLHLRDLYDASGIATCAAHHNCGLAESGFSSSYQLLRALLGFGLLATPALLGMFWGAPMLARELEHGTYKLAWTQSVTRTRWLAVKMALGGLAAILLAELYSLALTWWAAPIDHVNLERFNAEVFDQRGIVAIGYAAFAFALGVTAGAMTRRTLTAMALTLLLFIAVRVGFSNGVRPYLMPPAHKYVPISLAAELGFVAGPGGITFTAGSPSIPNALVVSSQIITKDGEVVSAQALAQYIRLHCPRIAHPPPVGPVEVGGGGPGTGGAKRAAPEGPFTKCIQQISAKYEERVSYQPASRYWAFQALEMAIFLVLGGILAGGGLWWVRRRLA